MAFHIMLLVAVYALLCRIRNVIYIDNNSWHCFSDLFCGLKSTLKKCILNIENRDLSGSI